MDCHNSLLSHLPWSQVNHSASAACDECSSSPHGHHEFVGSLPCETRAELSATLAAGQTATTNTLRLLMHLIRTGQAQCNTSSNEYRLFHSWQPIQVNTTD